MNCNIVSTIVNKVFPKGTELCTKGKAANQGSRFWVIPGKQGEARWILPDDPKCALPFLRQWTPYDLQSRIKWNCLMIAYRWQMLDRIPGIIPLNINVPPTSNWEHLGWTTLSPVPVIYVGTPGTKRKAVLGLIDSQKRSVSAIGKVPLGPTAEQAINHEIDLLDSLSKEKPGQAPRTLFVDRENGIATQEFFSGMPTGRSLTEHHIKFLADLAIPGETISLSEAMKEFERELHSQKHIEPEARKVLERVIAEIDDPSALPAVWEHGDFAPWNLKNANNGSLRAIDWEAASRRGLPLFDLVHFHSIQAFEFKEKELFPKQFKTLLHQYLERLGITLGMTRKIVLGCIARDWLRRLEEGDRSHAAFLFRMLTRPIGDLV